MNPENQQTPPVEPQPAQPVEQPTTIQQPATTSVTPVTGMTPPTTQNLQKQKKLALILSIASVVIFVVGLIVGYVFAVAAVLGAYGVLIGIRTKTVYLIIIGALGLVLNFGLYTLSLF